MAVTEAQMVSRMDWQATLRGQFTGERFKEEARKYVEEANTVESLINNRRTEIDHNADLSDTGRNNALQTMREQLRPRVRQFETKAQEFREVRKREQAKRQEPEPEGDPATIAIRAQEIRSNLRGMENGEVLTVLQRAGRDGDVETIKSIENAPKSAPLADPDGIAAVREERLAESYPEATERLADQEALIELLDSMALHLGRRLEA